MNAAIQTINLQVNEQALIQNLRYAFTSHYTFVAELMQNARRSGSPFVHIELSEHDGKPQLTVCDLGHGIDDLQNLLQVASSGWGGQVKETECPFGMGFLASLFAAEHVEVRSKGQQVSFFTEDAIRFLEIPIEQSEVIVGTRVTLTGFHATLSDLSHRIERFCEGFPIPVIFNGKEMLRPAAMDTKDCQFFKTDIGMVSIRGLSQIEPVLATTSVVLYLQGQRVYSTFNGCDSSNSNIVHLDASKFFGRLPDRDVLTEDSLNQAKAGFNEILFDQWRSCAVEAKRDLTAEQFVNKFADALEATGCLDLLNDVPLLPRSFLSDLDDYPNLVEEAFLNNGSRPQQHISRQDVEKGFVKVVSLDDTPQEDEGFQAFMFAYASDNLYVLDTHKLHEEHWVFQLIVDLANEDIDVAVKGVRAVDHVRHASYFYPGVIFCDHIELTHRYLGTVVITDDAFVMASPITRVRGLDGHSDRLVRGYNGDPEVHAIVYPVGECTAEVVRQAHSFMDEWDTFNETECDLDQEIFARFVASHKPNGMEDLMVEALKSAGIDTLSNLEGKSFRIEIGKPTQDESGRTYNPEIKVSLIS